MERTHTQIRINSVGMRGSEWKECKRPNNNNNNNSNNSWQDVSSALASYIMVSHLLFSLSLSIELNNRYGGDWTVYCHDHDVMGLYLMQLQHNADATLHTYFTHHISLSFAHSLICGQFWFSGYRWKVYSVNLMMISGCCTCAGAGKSRHIVWLNSIFQRQFVQTTFGIVRWPKLSKTLSSETKAWFDGWAASERTEDTIAINHHLWLAVSIYSIHGDLMAGA